MANTHSLDLEASSSQYASISDASQTGLDITGDITIEAWIKLESQPPTDGFRPIVSKTGSGNNRSYDLMYQDDSGTKQLRMNISSDGGSTNRDLLELNYTLQTGVWTHVAAVWDASQSEVEYYVNGLSVGTVSGSQTSIYQSNGDFEIGSNTVNSLYFDGLIDEVRVWNDIRTAQEIQDNLGKELVGNEANLQGYWKLNNNYTDSTSNGNNLTASSSPVFTVEVPFEDPTAIIDTTTKVLDLEASSSQYASITDAAQTGLDFSSALTLELWVKPEVFASSRDYFLIQKGTTATGQYAYGLYFANNETGPDGNIAFNVSSDGTGTERNTYYTDDVVMVVGVWTHIAVTFDASSEVCKVYVNGKDMAITQSGTAFAGTIHNSSDPFTLGRESTVTGREFDGQIRHVRAFNDVRTQAEIVADARTVNVTDANLQGEWVLDGDYADTSGNSNTLTATNSPVFVNKSNEIANALVSYWTLDETSGTRADSHGSNDLTDNNTVLSGTGILSNGADFEASNSEYLSIADGSQTGLDITGDIAISAWVKLESDVPNSSSYQIVSKYNTSSQRAYEFNINDPSVGNDTIRFLVSNNGTTDDIMSVEYTFTSGIWYHVAASWDASASTATFYVNGLSIGTDTGTATSIYNSTSDLIVGARPAASPTNFFDGIIDEVGIWSRVLTAGEISNLYNEGNALPYAGISFSVSDTVTLTENITNLRTRNFSVSETTTLTESVTSALGKIVEIAETVSLSETLTTARTYITNIVESVTLTEIKAQVFKLWNNKTRNTSSWTDKTRNTSSWNNKSRS